MKGQGRFTWPDKTIFEGKFLKNKKDGPGKLKLASGIQIEGTWVDDYLEGKAKVTDKMRNDHWVQFRKNIMLRSNVENSIKSDRQWLNMSLVAIAAACGVGALVVPEKAKELALASGLFYSLQLVESFTSTTWGSLNDIQTPEQAV